MPRLQVLIGPDMHHMEPCRVNDTRRPHEIDTEHFVGRVLVRILDAPGAREGEEAREYFKDRSRRFCIQIEGRFKQEWNGDDIHFGSDFDKFISFPRAPFNAGMKVAKMIDPCTFYEEQPPSGRPYIMSPYCACMNVLCAWPAPSRAHDAVVVLRHTSNKSATDHSPDRPSTPLINPEQKGGAHDGLTANGGDAEEEEDDVVPREGLNRHGSTKVKPELHAPKPQKKKASWFGGVGNVFGGGSSQKEERVLKKYWRFVGFKDEPRVRALLEAHHTRLESKRHLMPDQHHEPHRTSSLQSAGSMSSSATGPNDVQHGIGANHPTLSRLGTGLRRQMPGSGHDYLGTPQLNEQNPMDGAISPMDSPALGSSEQFFEAPEPGQRVASPLSADPDRNGPSPKASLSSSSSASAAPAMPPLQRITTDVRKEAEMSAKSDGLTDNDFRLADDFNRKVRTKDTQQWQSKLEDQLGPWRFDDPDTDMVEDNAFIFTNDSLSVPKRRKYFANKEHRKEFVYNPDVVYGASFFTDAFDFNTFNLSLGPVGLNISRYFKEMPVRYTLRASNEEPVFCTISFQLVD